MIAIFRIEEGCNCKGAEAENNIHRLRVFGYEKDHYKDARNSAKVQRQAVLPEDIGRKDIPAVLQNNLLENCYPQHDLADGVALFGQQFSELDEQEESQPAEKYVKNMGQREYLDIWRIT